MMLLLTLVLARTVPVHGHLPDPDNIPGVLEKWYAETLDSADNAQLHVEGKLPGWLVGDMFFAGPSQQKLGKERFMHIFDGFARTNKLEFDGMHNSIAFTSKMMDTKFYNKSIELGRVVASNLMAETDPPRLSSNIPLANLFGPNDNIYVVPWKIGNDYLYMTDGETRLRFDPKSLRIVEELTYTSYGGDAQPKGFMCATGSAHVVPDPRAPADGSFIGIMGCSPELGGKQAMVVYRVNASDIHSRHKIAHIDVPQANYMHSYSITKNHVILPGEPYYIDVKKMAMGKSLSDAFWYNISLGTTFYVVNIDSGRVQELTAPGFVFVHTVNAFEQDENTIVLDIDGVGQHGYLQEGLTKFLFNKTCRDTSLDKKLMRYILHLDTGRIDAVDAVPGLNGAVTILPRFNEKMRGSRACYVYAPAFKYNSSSFDSAAVVKMDLCLGSVAASYYAYAHFHGELIFVPRPGATEEDDGVLLGPVFDGVSQQSYVNVLEARTMQQVAKAYLPFRLPFMLHANFYLSAENHMEEATLV